MQRGTRPLGAMAVPSNQREERVMGEDTFKFVMVMLIAAGCVVLYFAPELFGLFR